MVTQEESLMGSIETIPLYGAGFSDGPSVVFALACDQGGVDMLYRALEVAKNFWEVSAKNSDSQDENKEEYSSYMYDVATIAELQWNLRLKAEKGSHNNEKEAMQWWQTCSDREVAY